MSFAFSTMFPITNDNTEYELIENDYISFKAFQNKNKEKKISSNKSNEDKKKKFNAEIFSLDAFRSKKED